jgi:general secretion pathway protein G
VEILLVVVILGILAAIVVFAVQNLSGQSSTAACQGEYKTIETALESYKAEVGSYPSSWDDLTTTTTGSLVSGTLGPWLRELPPTASGSSVQDWYSFDSNGNLLVNGGTGGITNCV